MSHRQSFVRTTLSNWDMRRCILLPLGALLMSCSSPLEKAYQEAGVAEQLLQQGNLVGARMAVTRALGHRDDQVQILQLDAFIKFQMGDLIASYEAYRIILAIDPNHLGALVGVSQLGLSTGNFRESRAAIETALAIDPRQADVLLAKGIHALIRKEYDLAVETGEQINEFLPDDPRGIILRARGSFLSGEEEGAMNLLYAEAERIGNNRMIATALLENARTQPDVKIMLEQLSFLRSNSPESIDLAIDEANILYKSGQTEKAREIGAEILKVFGEDQGAIGRLLELWREYDAAPLNGQARARLADSGAVDARLIAARYYFEIGELDSAEQIVDGLDDDRGRGMLARIGVRRDRLNAGDTAEAILEEDEGNCNALSALAEARLATGKANDAVRAAQVVATDCLDRTDGYHILARAYRTAGRTSGIERVYREGIDTHPQDLGLTTQFSRWLLEQGRDAGALSAVRRLTKVAPARASTWKLYAEICEAVGNNACVAEANAARAVAENNFAIDLLPGQRPANPLTGQSQ